MYMIDGDTPRVVTERIPLGVPVTSIAHMEAQHFASGTAPRCDPNQSDNEELACWGSHRPGSWYAGHVYGAPRPKGF